MHISQQLRALRKRRFFPAALRIVILLPVVALSLYFGGGAAAGEPSPGELRRMLETRRAALGIQTEFPSLSREEAEYAPSAAAASPVALSSGTASSMAWIALAVFLAVSLLSWRRNLRPENNGATAARRGERNRTDEVRARMDVAREESDVLAERGDYAAAMHVLLLKSVEEMRRRLGVPIAQSLTSREILDRSALEPEARANLGDIVKRVEISWFGPHLPGAEDYARCRASFVTLGGILGRGGRA